MRDSRLRVPRHMDFYRYENGLHFTRSLATKALQKMKEDGRKTLSIEETLQKLKNGGVQVTDQNQYDAVVKFNELLGEYHPDSMRDEQALIQAVKKCLEKEKQHEGSILMHWYLDLLISEGDINFRDYM